MSFRVAAAVVLAIAWLPNFSVHAQTSTQAIAVRHGLRVTLSVPRLDFPRDALIRARLTIRNISKRTVTIASGLNAPNLIVLDGSGQTVFDTRNPLGHQTLVEPKGPGPRTFHLRAGKSFAEANYVVLRGDTVSTEFIMSKSAKSYPTRQVTGPRLHLHLTDEVAPTVTVSTAPLRATLNPVPPGAGPIRYFSQVQCGNSLTSSGWSTTSGSVVSAAYGGTCTPLVWHALAGWVGHPIVTIAYSNQPAGE